MANTPLSSYPSFDPSFASHFNTGGSSLSTPGVAPAFTQTSTLPAWMNGGRGPDTHELDADYANIPNMYSTAEYDRTGNQQQSRMLSSALSSGQNAAVEYANRARQAGGSMLGAGLVKAQAQTEARKSAGALALEQKKFDVETRGKAATQSALIANNIASLRQTYLKSLVDYTTSEDASMRSFLANQAATDSANRKTAEDARQFNLKQPQSGTYQVDNFGKIVPGSVYGTPFRDPTTGMPTGSAPAFGHG